jgi:hypothetical protein
MCFKAYHGRGIPNSLPQVYFIDIDVASNANVDAQQQRGGTLGDGDGNTTASKLVWGRLPAPRSWMLGDWALLRCNDCCFWLEEISDERLDHWWDFSSGSFEWQCHSNRHEKAKVVGFAERGTA